MLDGDIATRYSSGAGQAPGQWVEVDMGQAQTFNKIVLDSGSSTSDYAPSADIYVSSDGSSSTKLTTIAPGQGTGLVPDWHWRLVEAVYQERAQGCAERGVD
jgi:hypothetical protein